MTRPLPAKIGAIDAGMGRHDSEEDWNETREDSITPKGKPVSRVADKSRRHASLMKTLAEQIL